MKHFIDAMTAEIKELDKDEAAEIHKEDVLVEWHRNMFKSLKAISNSGAKQ